MSDAEQALREALALSCRTHLGRMFAPKVIVYRATRPADEPPIIADNRDSQFPALPKE